MSEIKVSVVNYGRKYLYMRYVDPVTGKTVTKSTGETTKKLAERAAAKWEAELQEGRYKPASKVTWEEFRTRYEDEVLTSLSANTAKKVIGIFNTVEELVGVDRLAKLDANQISRLQKRLREERKSSENTIKSILAHLKASLNWAKRVHLISEVPTFEMPRRAKGSKMMKGRGITTEEFERMLDRTFDIVGSVPALTETSTVEEVQARAELKRQAEADRSSATYRYRQFLIGLWWGGLRLSEAIDLSWDKAGHIEVDLTGEYPMLFIPGAKQKSGQDQFLPIAPEFAEQLRSIPVEERTGPVFNLGRHKTAKTPGMLLVSKNISLIGERAGVIVNPNPKKFASAHDFRRAFGERWSLRVMPATLQQMMRHESIETTMRFYVGSNSQKAAETIYAAFTRVNSQNVAPSGNTNENAENVATDNSPQTVEQKEF